MYVRIHDEGIRMNKKNEEELVEELTASSDKLGMLYPVLKTEDGILIDGNHRLKANPDWETKIVHGAKGKIDALKMRYITNSMRRTITASEKTEILTEIAQLSKFKPKRLAKELGVSVRTIQRYLPSDLKNKPRGNTLRTRIAKNTVRFSFQDCFCKTCPHWRAKDCIAGKRKIKVAIGEKCEC